jgi:hypothetical protein
MEERVPDASDAATGHEENATVAAGDPAVPAGAAGASREE